MSEIAKVVLENVAKALCDTSNKRVIFRGNECSTDGPTIVLPSLPDMVPEKIILLLRGMLDHEIGHGLWTDFDLYKRILGLRQIVLNAVEDVWTEIATCRKYPGCSRNLDQSFEYVVDHLIRRRWPTMDPFNKLLDLFIVASRYGDDHPFINEFGGEFQHELKLLDEEIIAAREATSTREALVIADRILKKLHQRDEEQEKKEQEKKEQEKKEQEKGSEEDEPLTESGEKPIESGEGKEEPGGGGAPGSAEPGESGSKESAEPGESGSKESAEPGEESLCTCFPGQILPESGCPLPGSIIFPSSVEELIREEAKELDGYRVYSTEKDIFEPLSIHRNGLEEYQRIKNNLQGLPAAMKTKLYLLLMSQKRSRWIGGKRSGFLNPAMASSVALRTSEAVFRDRHEGRKMNTAVSILCDLSGSMRRNGKMEKEKEALVLLGEALYAIGSIPFEILGFTGDDRYVKCSLEQQEKFGRWGSLDIYYVKLFEESFGVTQKARIGSMKAMRENYDGDSVMVAANRLMARKEPKKVLCVLSDGYPHCVYGEKGRLWRHLNEVTRRLEAVPGFYLLAFGILTKDPAKFYKNFIHVDDLAVLPASIMSAFHKILIFT